MTVQPRRSSPLLPLARATVPARVGEVARGRAESVVVTRPIPAQEA